MEFLNKVKIKRNKLSSEDEKYAWFLFLTFPFLGFIYAIKNYQFKKLRKFVIIFVALHGLTFIPIPNSDAIRLADHYEKLTNYKLEEYLFDIINIFSEDNLFPDVYLYTIFFVGNLFTNNPQLFFMLTSTVYFLVFTRLLNSFYDVDNQILKKDNALFFLGIVFLSSFSAGMTGVRWPLGLIVFCYGSYNLFFQQNFKFYIIAASSCLIHFSLAPAVAFLSLFYFVPFMRKPKVLLILAVFSFLAGSLISGYIFGNAEALGDVGSSKLSDYTAEGYVEKRERRQGGWNWYVYIARYWTYYFSIVAIFTMWFYRKKIKKDKIATNLFGFALLMISFSFIASGVLDIATNRYIFIVNFSSLSYLAYVGFLNPESKILRNLKYIYAPIFIIVALVTIRTDIGTLNLGLLTNPILLFFF
jgi:hypothetical protein